MNGNQLLKEGTVSQQTITASGILYNYCCVSNHIFSTLLCNTLCTPCTYLRSAQITTGQWCLKSNTVVAHVLEMTISQLENQLQQTSVSIRINYIFTQLHYITKSLQTYKLTQETYRWLLVTIQWCLVENTHV